MSDDHIKKQMAIIKKKEAVLKSMDKICNIILRRTHT
jgi:hypothetical protein